MFPSRAHALLTVLLVAGTTAWLALVLATPRWERPEGSTIGRATAVAFRAACSRVCHQRPERSFHHDGRAWPVCARCSGLYAGAAAGAWIALLGLRRAAGGRPLKAEALRWPLGIVAAPTALTWVAEYAGGVDVSNAVRCLVAVPLGATVAWLLASMATGRVD